MGNEQETPRIVVLGDFADHLLLVRREPEDREESKGHEVPFQSFRRPPQKPLLPKMIEYALSDSPSFLEPCGTIVLPDYEGLAQTFPHLRKTCGELISVLDVFPQSSRRPQDRDRLRIKAEYFHQTESRNPANEVSTLEGLLGSVKRDAQGKPFILVLSEQDAFLREALRGSEGSRALLGELVAGATAGVVVGLNGRLNHAKWLVQLSEILRRAPKDRLIVQISADALRRCGMQITKYGALEDTVRDIFECRHSTPLKDILGLTSKLVVVFRETGAMVLDETAQGCGTSLHFCPNFDKIAQADPAAFGRMPGKYSIFMASLTKELFRASLEQEPEKKKWRIGDALRLATVAFNHHFSRGFVIGPENRDPFSTLR